MLRSILVALDDTPGAVAARDAAIALARATGAKLTAAVVLDRPHTQDGHEAVPLGAGAFKAHRDAALTEQAEREAEAALADCAAAAGGLSYETVRLEDAPEPALVKAGATHDLIVLGRDCTLGREQADGGVAPVIEALLRDGARPLLVVPPGASLALKGPVLAAYDGSAPAREAFHLFALLGLAGGQPVRVAALGAGRDDALRLANEGVAILATRGIAAEPLPLTGRDVAEAVLAAVGATGARMMVMGAFGGSSLIRMLVGSTTDVLLRDCPVPIFIAR
ncbi:universal stress protein [Falsiroseomonas oryziterrae]|uniref:universal stress protein n=1 Tax=Falsiroseomonas oryziterrae TaxID=2911368 RepID=UPI001F3CB64F|nr:universal stress protein [Roseomonas sp. NPKOSM-4]